jgi:hypothetical protein
MHTASNHPHNQKKNKEKKWRTFAGRLEELSS